MKNLKVLTILFLATLVSFTGCKKYDEGPLISPFSKKMRLTNKWCIDKVIENGVDVTSAWVTAYSDSYSIEFKKDNSTTETWANNAMTTGTWQFISKKEKLAISSVNATSHATKDYTIKRLTNNELWLIDESEADRPEVHYKPK
ncbi:MAG: hypothetical protein PHD97_03880 [Bacteroidales bacterium]|nr:hypothetical protein [Bacteroidales bacterium]